jgi:hypothetical protein
MKTQLLFISVLFIFVSCSTSNVSKTTRSQLKLEKKAAQQEIVQKTVESGSFLIKMDRLQIPRGGFIYLLPSSNYIIMNNGYVRMRLGYIGRTYDVRGITGINLNGRATKYELISDEGKGVYDINIEVEDGGDLFKINLAVRGDEYCNATVSNIRIETIRYSGHLIPSKVQTSDSSNQLNQVPN